MHHYNDLALLNYYLDSEHPTYLDGVVEAVLEARGPVGRVVVHVSVEDFVGDPDLHRELASIARGVVAPVVRLLR